MQPDFISDPKLRVAAIATLTEYMGIAAEFVVDDSIADARKNDYVKNIPGAQSLFFFETLRAMLPPDVPFESVRSSILMGLEVS